MTDLATIRIPVDSSDMVQAVRESRNLERAVKMLVEAFDSGAIGANQFSKGLLQVKREYQDLFTSSQQATARIRSFAASLQDSKIAAEQATKAKTDLAMATKRAETAFALANQKAKEELQTLRNRAEFAWAMAMQRERESQMAIRAADQQAAAEKRLNYVMQESQAGARQSELFIQQLGYQVGDFAVQVQSGTSALVAFAQQGTQILGFLPNAGAMGAVAGAVLAVSTAVLNLGLNMMSTKSSTDQAKESIDNFKSSFDTLTSSQDAVAKAQERYTQAIYLSGVAQANVTPEIVQGLALEADARERLLRVEQTRFELRKFELEQAIRQQKEVVDGLMEEVNLLSNPDAVSSEFTRTRAESERLERVKQIVEANKEVFLTLAESQAELDLINSLLSGTGEEFDDILASAKELGITIPGIDFSKALSSAAQLAEQLGISVAHASNLMAIGGGRRQEVIFDPRDPNYDPIAAEMARMQEGYNRTSPFDPSRQPRARAGSGGGRREAQLRKEIELTKELTQAERDRQTIVRSIEGSLEDGFMAMVEGTKSVKDAFKQMAYEIIKELYRVLVVQRLVGGISSGLGMLTGRSTGSLGLPFGLATGGSMMPNRPYLVGEHGPELVIPRHSGTVVNANQTAGAMSGGGGVTVQNNISVTGSDAAMVRAEVAKMIPQITNATKAAVIDARLRGGQMKAAFG